jgi:hypothetical protein
MDRFDVCQCHRSSLAILLARGLNLQESIKLKALIPIGRDRMVRFQPCSAKVIACSRALSLQPVTS